MLFRLSAIAVALITPVVQAATSDYYDYDHPELWKNMPNSACDGQKNSPVNVVDIDCTSYEDYIMDNGDCTFADMNAVVTKNGVNMLYKDDSSCTKPSFYIPGIEDKYTGYNIHIHLSSEHTIDGGFFAAEMHMVHLRADGKRASVVGTMIEPDRVADNGVFESFLDSWISARNSVECGSCSYDDKVNRGYDSDDMHPYKMLETSSFYHYDGGLTTPGCDEIVWWNLAVKPMSISVKQFSILSDIILNTKIEKDGECKKITVASKSGSTSRPTQPLNGRIIQKICPTNYGTGGDTERVGGNASDKGVMDKTGDDSAAVSATVGIGAVTFAAAMAMGQMM